MKPDRNIYLNNKELLAAVKDSREQGKMTDKLARMLQLLCARYANKGNFVNYSYNSDMQSYAIMMLVRTWTGFNPNKSNNPFAFFTQCIKNSFIQYLNQEKRQRNVRDMLLVNQGLNPSFAYLEEASDTHYVEDEQDFEHIQMTAKSLNMQLINESIPAEDDFISEIAEDDEFSEVESESETEDRNYDD
ncbi:MAG: hypothetical protein ACXW2E_02105 [Nitrososphaeraceae archaeon]